MLFLLKARLRSRSSSSRCHDCRVKSTRLQCTHCNFTDHLIIVLKESCNEIRRPPVRDRRDHFDHVDAQPGVRIVHDGIQECHRPVTVQMEQHIHDRCTRLFVATFPFRGNHIEGPVKKSSSNFPSPPVIT